MPAGHSSYILQSDAGDYEHLYWWHAPPNYKHNGRWEQFRDTADMCDTEWHTWTCTLGYPVMGIWPEYSDGTDVNTVDRSKSRNVVVNLKTDKKPQNNKKIKEMLDKMSSDDLRKLLVKKNIINFFFF